MREGGGEGRERGGKEGKEIERGGKGKKKLFAIEAQRKIIS